MTDDLFDRKADDLEAEFFAAISRAYAKAADAIDLEALTAALEADDEDAVAAALNVTGGWQDDLYEALSTGWIYALLGGVVWGMTLFAQQHRSRANPTSEARRLERELKDKAILPLALRAFEAPMKVYSRMRGNGIPSEHIAQAMKAAIALTPDQAASTAALRRVLHRAIHAPGNTHTKQGVVLSLANRNAARSSSAGSINAAQRAILTKFMQEPMTEEAILRFAARHERALAKYRHRVIAQQEAVRALHMGEHLAFRQGQANRTIPRTARRFWQTRGDERVRHSHREVPGMNAEGRAANEAFKTPLGPVMFPPLEVNCRCRVVIRVPEDDGGE
ncbi:phage minor head protein [Brevundimonas sp. VNH65]|uniref:phage minor head protein n=1 Tax=Brevundimonas sp. VNH65 TaxID=3400917 RepID=UPI003C014EBB